VDYSGGRSYNPPYEKYIKDKEKREKKMKEASLFMAQRLNLQFTINLQ
jgi:hypothetical protein